MTETLDIFKTTESMLMFLTSDSIVNNMPKTWRHVFYPKMVDALLEMHSMIYYANSEKELRAEYLQKFLGQLQRLKSLTRVAHERKMISHGLSDHLSKLYESALKQARAWKKKSKQSSYDIQSCEVTATQEQAIRF